jgi:O-antigen biosynthesis protein
LREEYWTAADHFDFGCDLDRYSSTAVEARSGIYYYCRPKTPRRAYELAMVALDLFAARHPEVDIHPLGSPAGKVGFR